MVNISFPANLTEEEEMLQRKYAKLRKKKKALQAQRTPKPEPAATSEPKKRKISENVTSAEDAKEQAKKLLKSGAIKLESNNRGKQGFKRSKNLEKKLKDPEKLNTSLSFQPFSANSEDEKTDKPKARMKGLYDSFISSSDPREPRDSDREDRRNSELPKKGHTIYVHGHGLTEEICRKAFNNIGTIVNISMEKEKSCGFVTFEKMENAEEAITQVANSMVSGILLRVSLARRQPNFEQITDPSRASWSSIAASHSQKGAPQNHKDSRELVAYDEDDIF